MKFKSTTMKSINLCSVVLSFFFFLYGTFVNAQNQTQHDFKVHIKINEDGKEIADTVFTVNKDCGSKEVKEIISKITGNKFCFFNESDSLTNWNIVSSDDSLIFICKKLMPPVNKNTPDSLSASSKNTLRFIVILMIIILNLILS